MPPEEQTPNWNQMSFEDLMTFLLPAIAYKTKSPTTTINRWQDIADLLTNTDIGMLTGATAAPMYAAPVPFDPTIYTPTLDSYRLSNDPVWATIAQGIYQGDPTYTRASVLQAVRNQIPYDSDKIETSDNFIIDQVNKMFDEVAGLKTAESEYMRTMQEDLAKNPFGKMGLPQPTQTWGTGVDEYGMQKVPLPNELQSPETQAAMLKYLTAADTLQQSPTAQYVANNMQDAIMNKYIAGTKDDVAAGRAEEAARAEGEKNRSKALGRALPFPFGYLASTLAAKSSDNRELDDETMAKYLESKGITPPPPKKKQETSSKEKPVSEDFANQTKTMLGALLHTPGYRQAESEVKGLYAKPLAESQKLYNDLQRQQNVHDILLEYDRMQAEKAGITPLSFAKQEMLNKNVLPALLPFLIGNK